jgi:hypothetical protein
MIKFFYTTGFVYVFSIGFPNALELKPIESQTNSINVQIIPRLELFHIMAY